jgi:hypothetical protein
MTHEIYLQGASGKVSLNYGSAHGTYFCMESELKITIFEMATIVGYSG